MPKKKKPKHKKSKRIILKKNHFQEYYQQIVKISPLVAKILVYNEKARDDDNLLCIQVWKAQGAKEKNSFKNFKYKLIIGKFATPETITRSRRLMQSKHPSLRGTLYKLRHEAEERMTNQMKLFN